jgi:hypothetical protein
MIDCRLAGWMAGRQDDLPAAAAEVLLKFASYYKLLLAGMCKLYEQDAIKLLTCFEFGFVLKVVASSLQVLFEFTCSSFQGLRAMCGSGAYTYIVAGVTASY